MNIIAMNITKVVKLVFVTIALTAFAALWFAQDAKADETGAVANCSTIAVWDFAGLGPVTVEYASGHVAQYDLGSATSGFVPSTTGRSLSPATRVSNARFDIQVSLPPGCPGPVTPTTVPPTTVPPIVSQTTTTTTVITPTTVPSASTTTTTTTPATLTSSVPTVVGTPITVTAPPSLPAAPPASAVRREPQFTG